MKDEKGSTPKRRGPGVQAPAPVPDPADDAVPGELAPPAIERQKSPMCRVREMSTAARRHETSCSVEEAKQADTPGIVGAADICFAGLRADEPAPLLMRHPEATSTMLEVVLGFDDRVRVTPTLDYPWRCICMLRVIAADGTQWFGTGWLAGPRLVVTAGHVVHIAERGGWVREIEVIPAGDGGERPYGSTVSRRFRSVGGWVRDQTPGLDYGAILLPADAAYGGSLGYFGIASVDDQALAGSTVQLSGYPADKPTGTQWHHAREILRLEPQILHYDIDTAGGQSGAPVWAEFNAKRYVVGIHRGGHVTGNSAVRLTDAVYDNIIAWNGEAR
ncbi:trypsin-like serine peptidase [Arenibaculum sp.]|jgi:V8-like Glu-specific endopeptidase|uniref:trypsin-like serine peptidase n=1 Tax=Arenibaculum sp. TaxID=2865862 RepID=UPI002E0ECE91|nr:trypsin-like peptidase domain-containing protein [Arenibaculum sp.]